MIDDSYFARKSDELAAQVSLLTYLMEKVRSNNPKTAKDVIDIISSEIKFRNDAYKDYVSKRFIR